MLSQNPPTNNPELAVTPTIPTIEEMREEKLLVEAFNENNDTMDFELGEACNLGDTNCEACQ